jgi:acyl dehydratase
MTFNGAPVKEFSYLVTARDIRRFAQAIGDTNPLYQVADDEIAQDSEGIMAPALFCQAMTFQDLPVEALPADLAPAELTISIPGLRSVGGASHYEFYQYVRAGDKIRIRSCSESVTEKQGRSGLLFLVSVTTCFTNQLGEPVAKEVATYVKR